MSRSTFRHRAGLVVTLVAFALGITAGTALGWDNQTNHDYGHGHKKKPPPTVTTPEKPPVYPPAAPPPAPPPPAPPAAAPAAPAPAPAPVSPTVAPEKKKAGAKGAPAGGEQGGQNVPAEVAPAGGQTVALAPAVERKQLARTGLSPLVIALMGSFCLLGGGLLFRRALAR